MGKTHLSHAIRSVEPLAVQRLVHCGQHRDIDAARGTDSMTRLYRVEPAVPGFLSITYHHGTRSWAVKESLGNDLEGKPLLSLTDLTAVVSTTTNWHQMETALATYFDAPVCESHHDSPGGYRVKAEPRVDDNPG